MNKLLLTFALAAGSALMASATEYDLSLAGLNWEGDGNGYTTSLTVDGKSFTITTEKDGSSNELMVPTDTQIRVYKNSKITIESSDVTMKTIVFTCDGTNFAGEGTVDAAWTQTKVYPELTFTNETGANSFTFSATGSQVRLKAIKVSDTVEEIEVPPTPDATTVNSIADILALATDTPVIINFDMTVAYVNGSNVFVQDAAGDAIQIYNSNTLAVGNVLPGNGWTATYTFYNSVTPELTGAALPEATEGTFTPTELTSGTITNDDVNRVVMLKGVVFAEATPSEKANFTGTWSGNEYSFRNNYVIPGVDAGTYDVTLVVTIYNGAPSLYVINYNEGGEVPPVTPGENGTADDPLTVAEFLALGKPAEPVHDTYVTGIIVGFVNGSSISKAVFEGASAEDDVNTNVLIAASADETNVDYCIPVQLPKGDVRDALNLVSHPENLHATIVVGGTREAYFGVNALKNVTYYTIDLAAPDSRKDANLSFAQDSYTATLGEVFDAPVVSHDTNAAITYTSSNNNIATVDATSGAVTLVATGTVTITASAEANTEFKAGHASYTLTINPAPIENAIYTGLMQDSAECDWELDIDASLGSLDYVWSWKEYSNSHYLNGSAYKDGPVAAEALAVSPVIDLTYVVNAIVTFEQAAKFQTNLTQDCKLLVKTENGSYEELAIPTWPEAGSWTWSSCGDISLEKYQGNKIQFAFKYVSTDTQADTWEIRNFVVTGETSGVESIISENGEAVYFDLNGRQVKGELEKGIYIRVQNGKATKVIR